MLFLFSAPTALSQEYIVLQHRHKVAKQKKLIADRAYTIKTNDTTYVSKILGATDTTLAVSVQVKGKDTTRTYRNYQGAKDTTIVVPQYISDTLNIPFYKIQSIRHDWFENKQWLMPFLCIGAGAALGVALLPVAVIDEGVDGLKGWAIFEGALLAIAGPPIFIATRKTKYDLKKKWQIKTGD